MPLRYDSGLTHAEAEETIICSACSTAISAIDRSPTERQRPPLFLLPGGSRICHSDKPFGKEAAVCRTQTGTCTRATCSTEWCRGFLSLALEVSQILPSALTSANRRMLSIKYYDLVLTPTSDRDTLQDNG